MPTSATAPNPDPPSRDDGDELDLELVQRIQSGDTTAMESLLARYQHRLYAVCYRMVSNDDLAADLTQEAILKVIQGIDTFSGRSKVSTWLIRITMNVCLTHRRKHRLRAHDSLDIQTKYDQTSVGDRLTSMEPGPGERVEQGESVDRLSAALMSLPASTRAILVLRDVQGLDYEQIASVLELDAVGTVKSRLFRARVALREAMTGPDPE